MRDSHIIVLAAGASRRFGADDKMLAEVAGKSLLAWTLDIVRSWTTLPITVVLAPHSSPVDRPDVHSITAEHADRGVRWSLQAALDTMGADVERAYVVLGDDPVAAFALPDVIACAEQGSADIVAVERETAPHPVCLPRAVWPASAEGSEPDSGLRSLLTEDSTQWVTTSAPAPRDVDTPDDLQLLEELLTKR